MVVSVSTAIKVENVRPDDTHTRHADRLRELEADDPPLEPRPAFTFTQEVSRGLDKGCARGLPQPKKLGVNAIRAYSIDSWLNHDLCMATLSGTGIYVISDIPCVSLPPLPTNLLDQIKIIDVFSIYDNMPVFHVGNEVLTADAKNAVSFLKAMARDIKAYLTSISSTVLVSYANIGGTSSFRDAVSAYLSGDPSGAGKGRIALRRMVRRRGDYGVRQHQKEFSNYTVAVYFSEFGSESCSPTLSTSSMTDVWSGGLAFSYFSALSAGHEFGMSTLSSDNTNVTIYADLDNLVSQYATVSFYVWPLTCRGGEPRRERHAPADAERQAHARTRLLYAFSQFYGLSGRVDTSAVFTPTRPAGASSACRRLRDERRGDRWRTGGRTGDAMSVRMGLAAPVACVLGGMGLVWVSARGLGL
ncbi:Glucanosyltransferase-domain-containing protein [Mycena olivaceomarginata]|nr:Glucanosyltransferase-domain-containing protein [Mycena olivaceomarginata]